MISNGGDDDGVHCDDVFRSNSRSSNLDFTFVEIRPVMKKDSRPASMEAYVFHIPPQQCSALVKRLARDFPLKELSHLKRVKKLESKGCDAKEQKTRRLQVLLATVESFHEDSCPDLIATYGPLTIVTVPGRPPNSQDEWKEWNSIWPTVFFPLKSEEYQEQQLELKPNEVQQMTFGMEQLLSQEGKACAIILDPTTGKVIASSRQEASLQNATINNPLATPILLAIQGVSRLERASAMSMSTEDFSNGQYLCTGYDMYVTYEPNVFEAMACVHSRMRRLVFADGSATTIPLLKRTHSGGCSQYQVHWLTDTNHHYRVFRCFIEDKGMS